MASKLAEAYVLLSARAPGFAAVLKKSKADMSKAVKDMRLDLKLFGSTVGYAFVKPIVGKMQPAIDSLKRRFAPLSSFIKESFNSIKATLLPFAQLITKSFAPIVNILKKIPPIVNRIKKALEPVTNILKDITLASKYMGYAVVDAAKIMIAALRPVMYILGKVAGVFGKIIKLALKLAGVLLSVVKKAIFGVVSAIKWVVSKIYGMIKGIVSKIYRTILSLARKIKRVMKWAFAAITAGIVASIYDWARYERQLGMVATMLDTETMPMMKKFQKEISNLSIEFFESTKTLSKGLYDILSASIPAAEAMDVLKVSALAARAGFSDTGTAADAITTIINSYSLAAKDAMVISDWMFTIVKKGKTTFGELAPSLGRVAATGAQAGLSLAELGASLSTMTRAGIKTNEAVTALNRLITTFVSPTEDAKEMAAKYGIELSSTAIKTKGVIGALKELLKMQSEEIAILFPAIRSRKGINAIIAASTLYQRDYNLMLKSGGETMAAIERRGELLIDAISRIRFATTDAWRAFARWVTDLFNLKNILGEVKDHIVKFRDKINELPKSIEEVKEKWPEFYKAFEKVVVSIKTSWSIISEVFIDTFGTLEQIWGKTLDAMSSAFTWFTDNFEKAMKLMTFVITEPAAAWKYLQDVVEVTFKNISTITLSFINGKIIPYLKLIKANVLYTFSNIRFTVLKDMKIMFEELGWGFGGMAKQAQKGMSSAIKEILKQGAKIGALDIQLGKGWKVPELEALPTIGGKKGPDVSPFLDPDEPAGVSFIKRWENALAKIRDAAKKGGEAMKEALGEGKRIINEQLGIQGKITDEQKKQTGEMEKQKRMGLVEFWFKTLAAAGFGKAPVMKKPAVAAEKGVVSPIGPLDPQTGMTLTKVKPITKNELIGIMSEETKRSRDLLDELKKQTGFSQEGLAIWREIQGLEPTGAFFQ